MTPESFPHAPSSSLDEGFSKATVMGRATHTGTGENGQKWGDLYDSDVDLVPLQTPLWVRLAGDPL